ncbi:FecCD family ABC transporter permease [Desulfocicer niacini]
MKNTFVLLILVFGLVMTFFATLMMGAVHIDVITVAKVLLSNLMNIPQTWPDYYRDIVVNVRLPRVLLGTLVGCALSVSGCSMQALFKNPMASPFVCGVASGGAFGAALVIVLHGSHALIMPVAFVFSLLTVFTVYSVAKVGRNISSESLLLSGIALSLFFSAATSFLQYVAEENQLREIVFWLMGGLWAGSWEKVMIVVPPIGIGSLCLFCYYKELNILLLGDDQARDLGVNVSRTRKIVLVMTAFVTAGAVAVCGVIGFIGLIIPHVMRFLVGPNHQYLLPASCLSGAIFLVWVDTCSRSIVYPTELPVGIITAMVGVPFFLFLLRNKKKASGF